MVETEFTYNDVWAAEIAKLKKADIIELWRAAGRDFERRLANARAEGREQAAKWHETERRRILWGGWGILALATKKRWRRLRYHQDSADAIRALKEQK